MSETKTVEERVIALVDEVAGTEKAVTVDSNLQNDLGFDSLDGVELVMALEEEFDLEIPDDEAENFQTVENIVTFINNRLKSEGGEQAAGA